MPDNELMTVNEVAEYLRVDPNTVYIWLKADKLGSYKTGGVIRISREQLQKFMEAKR